jgi:hypothetical protein
VLAAPRSDDEVPAFAAALDRPGLVDVHTHFMPDPVMDKVWAYFDRVRTPDGAPGWPIHYRDGPAERLETLRGFGVRAFTSMIYAHKPGMAAWLNQWASRFAADTPDCAHTLTFFPESGVDRYVAQAIEAGARVGKVHLQVGSFDPREALLQPVWARLAAHGIPVVVHCGSGPHPGPHTGPGPFGEVLAAHPDLVAIIAHMGATEYGEFLDLALRYPFVHLDTTMAFSAFMERIAPYPRSALDTLAAHPERVVLGSDFPNIPYPYAHQLEVLVELGFGDDWLRTVCYDTGARLLGVAPPDSGSIFAQQRLSG